MALYEFQCNKCGAITASYFPITEAPPLGSVISCSCGDMAIRILSNINLRPEFFEYDLENAGEKPTHIATKSDERKFRREEYIKSTKGTHLRDTEGKLEYSDKYFKQDLAKKQKERQSARERAKKDKLQKAVWRTR